MNIDRLTQFHLPNWRDYQSSYSPKLQVKIIGIYGGADSKSFDDLADQVDQWAAETMEAMIYSMKRPQIVAIEHAWLKNKHCYPTQEYDLMMAYEALCKMADKRNLI